jgi:hypothetical protein
LNQSGISLYNQMVLCDKRLENLNKEFTKDSILKTKGTMTTVGYYIASQIFFQILEDVNYLHKQNPQHKLSIVENIILKLIFLV